MTTKFHVLGFVDLRRVVSARVEIVYDDGTFDMVPALHLGDTARTAAPRMVRRRAGAVPAVSRKVYRGKRR